MNGDDPAFDADDMGALFRAVLDQPEPAAPPELLPEVRRSGARLRRRRHLLATVATATAVGLLATAGWAVRGRTPAEDSGRALLPAAGAPGVPVAAPSPSGTSSPSAAPSPTAGGTADATGGPTPTGTAQEGSRGLLALLRAYPPEEIWTVARGVAPESLLLTRKDGGTVRVSRRLEGPSGPLGGTGSPCGPRSGTRGPRSPEGKDCVGTKLPDGSVVWALHPLSVAARGQEAEVRVVAPDGLVYALLFVRAETQPYPRPDDPTLALPQLLVLAGQPGFLQALRDGWGDTITGPAGTSGPAATSTPSPTP
ncbi:hypothetical protein [Kitasatospora sp. NPDC086791]|uniref:hypothetical protein n=1 Tax=Kitasatospora sp. NPDC086791 TaxID=3155178 RepID=UPI003431AC34